MRTQQHLAQELLAETLAVRAEERAVLRYLVWQHTSHNLNPAPATYLRKWAFSLARGSSRYACGDQSRVSAALSGTSRLRRFSTRCVDRRLAGEEAEPFEEVLARHERRNKLVLQIGDAGLLVWLSFA